MAQDGLVKSFTLSLSPFSPKSESMSPAAQENMHKTREECGAGELVPGATATRKWGRPHTPTLGAVPLGCTGDGEWGRRTTDQSPTAPCPRQPVCLVKQGLLKLSFGIHVLRACASGLIQEKTMAKPDHPYQYPPFSHFTLGPSTPARLSPVALVVVRGAANAKIHHWRVVFHVERPVNGMLGAGETLACSCRPSLTH